MRASSFRSRYDVVVIGAGLGGLTSAAVLSRAGLSVCVLEMDARPGGYLAGFRRKDHRFDSAIHWLNQLGPNGLVTRVFDLIGPDHPTAAPQKRIKRYKGDSFDYLLTDRPDDLKEQWIREFPHERAGIERFFRDALRIGRAFDGLGTFMRTTCDSPAAMSSRPMPSGSCSSVPVSSVPLWSGSISSASMSSGSGVRAVTGPPPRPRTSTGR